MAKKKLAAAVELGRRGGKARAKALTADERRAIATRAITTRWQRWREAKESEWDRAHRQREEAWDALSDHIHRLQDGDSRYKKVAAQFNALDEEDKSPRAKRLGAAMDAYDRRFRADPKARDLKRVYKKASAALRLIERKDEYGDDDEEEGR